MVIVDGWPVGEVDLEVEDLALEQRSDLKSLLQHYDQYVGVEETVDKAILVLDNEVIYGLKGLNLV